jgi:replicative DNA helicase Mcm
MSTAGEMTLTDKLQLILRRYHKDEIGELATSGQRSLPVDLQDVYQYDHEICKDCLEKPDQMREYFEEALREYDLPADISLDNPRVRFTNVGDARKFDVGEYSVDEHLGEVIGIEGQVNKRSQKRPRIVTAQFECARCGTPITVPQDNGGTKRQDPHECPGCERQGPFHIMETQSEFVDDQQIRVQLPPEKAEGSADTNIDISLEGDLVNSVEPGDRIRADSVLTLAEKEQNSKLFDYVARAEDVVVEESDFSDIEYSEEDVDRIHDIAADTPFADIIDSIAPAIQGLETPKLAIALQLFGGVEKELPDGSIQRGDSHVFLIGDPGTAKSELLSWAHRLAPRSVFSDGKGSSAAGITAAAVRDDFGDSEWTIEGGTIVKAHNGMACIDELDDMDPDDRSALHTALEKQEVPVSKAGITATLPAKTRLLAAGNPKHGRFDIYEPITDQINIKPTLMSRFDLIFTFTDVPDREEDEEIINHKATTAEVGQKRAAGIDVAPEKEQQVAPEIEEDLLRKYIAYAQRNVSPVFDSDAKQLLIQEFNELRQANASQETDPEERPVPVTYRKMEGITRLSEASARIRLSNTITIDDVERALQLVEESMRDVGMDPETGEYDADVVETGTSHSQRERIKTAKNLVEELATQNMDGAPHDEVVETLTEELSIREKKAVSTIETLRRKGELYEPNTDHYRTT